VLTGLRIDGVTERLPYAGTLPLHLTLRADLAWGVQVSAWWAPAWQVFGDRRDESATAYGFSDEFETGARLRLGKGGERYRMRWGNGSYLGVRYRELLGTRAVSLLFGYGLSVH
jgi:hypothetical protein